jgi:formate dehydrogenase subunit delta
MSPDKLVYMANQIGTFFHAQTHGHAVDGIAEHIRKFWEPRMREQINAHLDRGGEGLQPEVKAALERLRAEEKIAA